MQLVKYDAMCKAISVCEKLDEAKVIRDKALALEAYARQARNTDAERQALNIRLRAERRCGQLLKDMKPEPGKRVDLTSHHGGARLTTKQQARKNGKISKRQGETFENLADIPDEEFETILADPVSKPTTKSLLASQKKPTKPKVFNPQALWLWGRMRDFEREKIFSADLPAILGELTPTMRKDVKRLSTELKLFFTELEDLSNEK